MRNSEHNISLELVLKSLDDDFDANERKIIFEILKNNDYSDDELAGIKLVLESHNWDHSAVNQIFLNLNNKIDSLAVKHSKTNKKEQFNFIKYAAILITFLSLIGFYLLNKPNEINKFYIKEKGLPNLMAKGNNSDWNAVMEPYKKGNTKEAFKNVIAINEIKKGNDTAIYFKAVIAYELKKFDLSNEGFKQVGTFEKSVFKFDAEFRLGFSLYQLNKKKEAEKVFQKINNNPESPFQEEAKEILAAFF